MNEYADGAATFVVTRWDETLKKSTLIAGFGSMLLIINLVVIQHLGG